MAVFMIETDAVLSSKSSVESMASQVMNLASTVNGYDTSCEEFDFSSPKGVIARNIEAAAVKFQNVGKIMDSVVSSHTELQNKLKFTGTEAANPTSANPTSANPTSANPTSANPTSKSPTYSGPSYSYSGPSYSYSEPETPTAEATPTTTPEIKITEIAEKIQKAVFVKLDLKDLTDELKAVLKFNDDGLLVFDGLFVVACSAAYGKVGDIVKFTLKDGKTVDCYIGGTIPDSQGELRFFTNDSFSAEGAGSISPSLAENIQKTENYGSYFEQKKAATAAASTTTAAAATTSGSVSTANLPKVGEHTSSMSALSDSWVVPTTKQDVASYASYVQGKISQNANTAAFNDKCLSFAETHAYALYTGNTGDSAERASNYPHSGAFTSWFSDSKEDTLKKVYSEVVQGRPVVIQVNGNKAGTSRHFVTVVGFRGNVSDSGQLSEKDLLIIDSWDGKLERMDQANSRFLTTGKACGKSYSGYYLRVLKA